MELATAVTAPKITETLIQRVLENTESVIVWLPELDICDVAEGGLTKAQAAAPSIVPVLTHASAARYVTGTSGDTAKAARVATSLLAGQVAKGWL